MPNPLPIRRLGPQDLAGMRDLNRLFGKAFDEQAMYEAEAPGDAYLSRVLAYEQVVALAAFDGSQVVGGLVAYELPKLEQARSEVYIYDLAVAADHRRRGVATSLIAHLREIVRQRGGQVIFVQADYGDEPAISLYEKLGVREAVLHFDIRA